MIPWLRGRKRVKDKTHIFQPSLSGQQNIKQNHAVSKNERAHQFEKRPYTLSFGNWLFFLKCLDGLAKYLGRLKDQITMLFFEIGPNFLPHLCAEVIKNFIQDDSTLKELICRSRSFFQKKFSKCTFFKFWSSELAKPLSIEPIFLNFAPTRNVPAI